MKMVKWNAVNFYSRFAQDFRRGIDKKTNVVFVKKGIKN